MQNHNNNELFSGQTLLNEALEHLGEQRNAAEELLKHGTPIKVMFTITDPNTSTYHDMVLTLRKQIQSPPATFLSSVSNKPSATAQPYLVPLVTTPTPNPKLTQLKKKRSLLPLIVGLLLLLLLIGGTIGTALLLSHHPSPVTTHHTTTQKQALPAPIPFCQQTNEAISQMVGAPAYKLSSFPNVVSSKGCILIIQGNFVAPTHNQPWVGLFQRGFGLQSDQKQEVIEIVTVHNGPYTVSFSTQVGFRSSMILVDPTEDTNQIVQSCNTFIKVYSKTLPNGDRIPKGCYTFQQDHP